MAYLDKHCPMYLDTTDYFVKLLASCNVGRWYSSISVLSRICWLFKHSSAYCDSNLCVESSTGIQTIPIPIVLEYKNNPLPSCLDPGNSPTPFYIRSSRSIHTEYDANPSWLQNLFYVFYERSNDAGTNIVFHLNAEKACTCLICIMHWLKCKSVFNYFYVYMLLWF